MELTKTQNEEKERATYTLNKLENTYVKKAEYEGQAQAAAAIIIRLKQEKQEANARAHNWLSETVTTNRPARRTPTPVHSHTHTQKSEMETLPEAQGRSAEQSQPPETCAKNDYGEIIEEKSSVPVRQHFVLSNARYLSIPLPLFYSPRREAVIICYIILILRCPFGQRYTSILSLLNACYLGFTSANLYLPTYYTT